MSDARRFTEAEVEALARDAYEHGDAGFAVDPQRAALLVIDMQDEFVKPEWTPYWVPAATRIIPRIAALIAACRERGVPVIHTAFAATHHFLDRPKPGSAMPNRYPAIEPDPAWFREARFAAELTPAPGDVVILKPSYGAFYDTPLETILKNLERDTIVIAGTLTNYCCGLTARQGYERGFRVVFGSDVTATETPEMHENELRVLRRGFARVLCAAGIVAALGPAAAIERSWKQRARPLESMLAEITPENRHEEIDWGPEVGREKW